VSRQATEWRNRVVHRFFRNELRAQTIEEQDHWHLCREILRRALDGWRDPWVAAHYYLYGLHPRKLPKALAERDAWMHRQTLALRKPPQPDHRSNKVAACGCTSPVLTMAMRSSGIRSIISFSPQTRTATVSPALHGSKSRIALTSRMHSDPPYLWTLTGIA
jgi:hypothetical protein